RFSNGGQISNRLQVCAASSWLSKTLRQRTPSSRAHRQHTVRLRRVHPPSQELSGRFASGVSPTFWRNFPHESHNQRIFKRIHFQEVPPRGWRNLPFGGWLAEPRRFAQDSGLARELSRVCTITVS